jgi:hypothetical protein
MYMRVLCIFGTISRVFVSNTQISYLSAAVLVQHVIVAHVKLYALTQKALLV